MFDLAQIPRIETERLILRAWREEDVEPFVAMMAEPEVARFLTLDRQPQSRADAWRFLATIIGHWALRGYGMFAVEEKGSGVFVGRIGVWRPEGWLGHEIGWGIRHAFWGRGYATEAARAAGTWTLDAHPIEQLQSLVDTQNTRSEAVTRRLGMQPGGETLHAGTPHVIWRIDRADWMAVHR